MSGPDLVLRLSGEATNGRANGTVTITPSALGSASGWRLPKANDVAVVGSPPADDIGAGLAPLVVLAARGRRVTVVDARTRSARRATARRYLAETLVPGLVQLAGSGVAIGAQAALARELLRRPPRATTALARRPERIAYVRALVGASAGVGGAVTHTHEVIRALSGLGVEIEPYTTDAGIAATAANDPEPPCSWRVVDVPRATKGLPASLALGGDLALARAALPAARRADVIYQRHVRFSLAGALLARLSGKPLILEYNGSESFFRSHWQPTAFGGQLQLCEDAMLAAATRIVVVAEVERELLIGRGIEPERVVVNPNGVDVRRFERGSGAALRERLGFGSDHFVIGFVGSFGPWHGAKRLAEAFVKVAEELPQARLLLVGEGEELPAVRKTLRAEIEAGRVVLAGRIAPSEIPAHLDACDALASPHVPLPGDVPFFGSPTKLFEYMAAGRPIVASRLGQIGDVLEHERTALMVEPGDAGQLADALVRLAHDAELRDRIGEAARAEAAERHTWTANAERVLSAAGGGR